MKALIVSEVQNDYFQDGLFPLWNSDRVLGVITNLIEEYHQHRNLVILTRRIAGDRANIAPFFNDGSRGSELHPGLSPFLDNCSFLKKRRADNFEGTGLAEMLAGFNIKEIYICGMMTQDSVLVTAMKARDLGYGVTVGTSSSTSSNRIIHEFAIQAIGDVEDIALH